MFDSPTNMLVACFSPSKGKVARFQVLSRRWRRQGCDKQCERNSLTFRMNLLPQSSRQNNENKLARLVCRKCFYRHRLQSYFTSAFMVCSKEFISLNNYNCLNKSDTITSCKISFHTYFSSKIAGDCIQLRIFSQRFHLHILARRPFIREGWLGFFSIS